jgi:hypothetical protein
MIQLSLLSATPSLGRDAVPNALDSQIIHPYHPAGLIFRRNLRPDRRVRERVE